jgi:hypothetical protein
MRPGLIWGQRLPPSGPKVRFRRVQTLVREGSSLVKLRNSAWSCRPYGSGIRLEGVAKVRRFASQRDFKKLNDNHLEGEDMGDVAMTKESRITKPPIPFVQLNAFVMPLYDYDMSYAEGLKFEATSIRHAQE